MHRLRLPVAGPLQTCESRRSGRSSRPRTSLLGERPAAPQVRLVHAAQNRVLQRAGWWPRPAPLNPDLPERKNLSFDSRKLGLTPSDRHRPLNRHEGVREDLSGSCQVPDSALTALNCAVNECVVPQGAHIREKVHNAGGGRYEFLIEYVRTGNRGQRAFALSCWTPS